MVKTTGAPDAYPGMSVASRTTRPGVWADTVDECQGLPRLHTLRVSLLHNPCVVLGLAALTGLRVLETCSTYPVDLHAVPLLPPGTYQLRVAARGFNTKIFDTVQVAITETTLVNADAAL